MKLENTYLAREKAESINAVLPEWLMALSNDMEIEIAQCESSEGCNNGDISISYHTKESLEDKYMDAIQALEIENEVEEEMYMQLENIDSFKGSLLSRIDKTKLWNYPPDVRDDIKRARSFISNFLEHDVPYGFSVLVPADEAEAFMSDEKNRFGIRECEYQLVEKPELMPINNSDKTSSSQSVGGMA